MQIFLYLCQAAYQSPYLVWLYSKVLQFPFATNIHTEVQRVRLFFMNPHMHPLSSLLVDECQGTVLAVVLHQHSGLVFEPKIQILPIVLASNF